MVYGLEERRVWALARYLDKLNSGVLGINLKPNPSPLGSLVRALRRLMIWDARPSFELRTFIENEITIHPWNEVIAAEQEAFHAQYLHEVVSASVYLLAVLAESKFKNLGSHKKRQMLFTKVDLPEAAY